MHSDVGGGYAELEHEERQLLWEERQQLVQLGWYSPQQVREESEPVYDPETGWQVATRRWAVGVRLGLRPDYQFIPLRIMADQARKYALDLEELSGDFTKYTVGVNHELAPVQAAILAKVLDHGGQGRHALVLDSGEWQVPPDAQRTTLPLTPAQVLVLRHRYLHRSGSTGVQGLDDGRIGMGERREDNLPHRKIFPG